MRLVSPLFSSHSVIQKVIQPIVLMLHHHHQPSVHVATAPYVSKSPSSTAVVVCHSVVSLPLFGKNTLDVEGLDYSNKLTDSSLALSIVQ